MGALELAEPQQRSASRIQALWRKPHTAVPFSVEPRPVRGPARRHGPCLASPSLSPVPPVTHSSRAP